MDLNQTPPAPRPLYISDQGESIFAFFHDVDGPTREMSVLLCPPFGEEDMSSYRSRREWASQLAQAGFATLRIDLPGSGDSSGGPRDPERLRAWTDAVSASADWLSRTTGARRLVAVGIGLGGAVACRALELGAAVDDLVLWGVSARGSRHLRELRAFSQLASPVDEGEAQAPAGPENLADSSMAVSGYLLSAETQQELSELDLAQLDRCLSTTRVLMLERDGRPVDSRLKDSLESCGAQVTVSGGDGYAAMMMAGLPHAVSAHATFATVTAWLEEGVRREDAPLLVSAEATTSASASHRLEAHPSIVEPLEGGHDAAEASGSRPAMEEADSAEISMAGGRLIRETPIAVPHPRGDLFAILAEPVGPSAGLTAVWLNAGPQRRIGPSRMWVETARRWAALGVPTLRVDLTAIGDAAGDPRTLLEIQTYYTSNYLEQVRLVLDTLEARGLPPRFLLGGLCAGGYWALRIAQEDPRVSALAAFNPAYIVYDGGLSKAVGHSRAVLPSLLRRSTWARAARGQITTSAHLSTLRILLTALGRNLLRLPSRTLGRNTGAGANPVARAFDRLGEQDQRALLLFAGEERLYLRLLANGSLNDLHRRPHISLRHIAVPGDAHTLRPLSLQQEAHRLVDELLHQELARIAD